jgi:aspartate/glutamate racemase
MKKVAVVHATCNAVGPLQAAFAKQAEGITVVNIVNEEMLLRANRLGRVDPTAMRYFLRTAMMAADAEPDVILIACTVYIPYINLVEKLTDIPVIGIDQPMLERAAQFDRVGIIATTAAAGPNAKKRIEAIASEKEKSIQCDVRIVTEAMTRLKAGDGAGHDQLIREAARELAREGCDSIVLAQITMARAARALQDLGLPILTSPTEGVRKILEILEGQDRQRGD